MYVRGSKLRVFFCFFRSGKIGTYFDFQFSCPASVEAVLSLFSFVILGAVGFFAASVYVHVECFETAKENLEVTAKH